MDTFNKKELQKKRKQKQKDKEERKAERKANAKPGKSLEAMMAYVDENGNITSTPPDILKSIEVELKDIVTGSRNTGSSSAEPLQGVVEFFNVSKGFGFIRNKQSGEKIFVHQSSLLTPVKDNLKVIYEIEKGPRGLQAKNVKQA